MATIVEVEYTGDGVIRGTFDGVTNVRFHSSVTEVGSLFAASCLREVLLNEGLRKIGAGAFSHCRSLESITFPSTLVEVGRHAFHDCGKLKYVVLNESLKKIGHCAFMSCPSLSVITIPSTITEIDNQAFRCCFKLEKVVLNEGLKKIGY